MPVAPARPASRGPRQLEHAESSERLIRDDPVVVRPDSDHPSGKVNRRLAAETLDGSAALIENGVGRLIDCEGSLGARLRHMGRSLSRDGDAPAVVAVALSGV